jgi:class 3 adenylate cyclase
LSPSRSIRMGMASIFADIDGYTDYVDRSIQKGSAAITEAVRDIHVLREELNSVLKEDFGGKRVRFIGDCIHGVLAEGKFEDDGEDTVREAALCACGMRSSFLLAKEFFRSMTSLNLAIGIEYGPIPLTRLGSTGSESVRCAAGLAVTRSEQLQQSIRGGGVILGQKALEEGDSAIRKLFRGTIPLMEYADAADHLRARNSPTVQIIRNDAGARPHSRR